MIAQNRLSILFAETFLLCLIGATTFLVYLAFAPDQDILAPGDLTAANAAATTQHSGEAISRDDLALETFLPEQTLVLSSAQALALNLARPLARTNPTPPAFDPMWLSDPDRGTAATCLATAVYYEANSEPLVGQQAVAQVVLNRLRNPHYPKTVCDVVYDGAQRHTGCQFTFACDGSLARHPDPAGFARARAVAEAALRGAISFPAGQATHYHTIWIVPRWADELAKVAIIGHHVFYRPPNPYGGYALASAVPRVEPSMSAAATAGSGATTSSTPGTLSSAGESMVPGPALAPTPSASHAPSPDAAPTTPTAAPTAKPKTVFFPAVRRTPPTLAIPSNR